MRNKQPLVSVLVTCYNRKNYIKDALESILSSTYYNYELIIVDDASTDGSSEIINDYISKDPKIKVFVNNKNLGQFENRNYAASLASGEYIKFLDSDDMIYPYALEVMVNAAQMFPEAGLIASCDTLHESKPYPIYVTPREAYQSFFLSSGFPNVGPSATLIKKTAFDSIGGFPKPYFVGTDSVLLLMLAAKFPLVKLPPALNWYRKHEDQALQKGLTSNEYILKEFKAYTNILNMDSCPLFREEILAAKKRLIKQQFRLISKSFINLNISVGFKLIKQLQEQI